jgi:hypothetical protein
MKKIHSFLSSVVLVCCVMLLSVPDAGAGWSAVSLQPTSGGYDGSNATSVSGGQIGGFGFEMTSQTEYHPYPGIWNTPSGAAFTRVGPAAPPAFVQGVSGGLQAGYTHQIASWWKGTTDVYFVDTDSGAGAQVLASYLYGISGGWVVGHRSVVDNRAEAGVAQPMLWKLTNDYSEVGINLLPSGQPDGTTGSVMAITGASGSNPGKQVGSVGLNTQVAAYWQGTAASYVNLHPDYVAKWNASVAKAACGVQQGGMVEVWDGRGKRLESHAALWSGTAASFQDLHPTDVAKSEWDSFVEGVTEGVQVGYLMSPDGKSYEAALWEGTAASYLNLNDFLPAGYSNGFAAAADWVNGQLWIVGNATNNDRGRDEAMLWIYTNTVPEPSTYALFCLGVGAFALFKRKVRNQA